MSLHSTNLLVENLYYLLWLKDSGLKDGSFAVRIPHTIIVSQGKILNWFFSSSKGEGIMMKKETNLNGTKIFESFTQKEHKCGIVALFIENVKNLEGLGRPSQAQSGSSPTSSTGLFSSPKNSSDIPSNEGEIVVRYLTRDRLRQFLFEEKIAEKSGILQAFVPPYGDHEALIQAVWSPSLCVFSKRVNYRALCDTRYDAYERVSTFAGAEMYSRTVPLRGKLVSQEMRKFCENIVERISNVTFQKTQIQRMVVYFKPDETNAVNFLYCSSLRLQGERVDVKLLQKLNNKVKNTPSAMDTNYAKPPEIKLSYTTNTMRPVSLENDINCFNCEERIQTKDLVPLTYEFIINNFEENPLVQLSKISKIAVLEAPDEQDFVLHKPQDHFVKDQTSEIPHLLTKLYPKLNAETYRSLRVNKKFLSQKIKLCQYCYLDFTRYVKMSGAPLKGIQDLRFMKKGLSKRGALFSREMKAIIAAKNVEMTEQPGSEFVKYQSREVYQRMLDHLLEEMERIERENNNRTINSEQLHIKKQMTDQPHSRPVSSISQKLSLKLKVIKGLVDRTEEGDIVDDEYSAVPLSTQSARLYSGNNPPSRPQSSLVGSVYQQQKLQEVKRPMVRATTAKVVGFAQVPAMREKIQLKKMVKGRLKELEGEGGDDDMSQEDEFYGYSSVGSTHRTLQQSQAKSVDRSGRESAGLRPLSSQSKVSAWKFRRPNSELIGKTSDSAAAAGKTKVGSDGVSYKRPASSSGFFVRGPKETQPPAKINRSQDKPIDYAKYFSLDNVDEDYLKIDDEDD